MAKKKTESAEKPKKAAAKSAPAADTSVPQIDTKFAAEAAAKTLAAGGNAPTGPGTNTAPRQESAGFKQMKAGLNKPTLGGGAGNLLGNLGGGKKSNQPFGGGKQVGRNQTFGADVNRAGVPRRTGGG